MNTTSLSTVPLSTRNVLARYAPDRKHLKYTTEASWLAVFVGFANSSLLPHNFDPPDIWHGVGHEKNYKGSSWLGLSPTQLQLPRFDCGPPGLARRKWRIDFQPRT